MITKLELSAKHMTISEDLQKYVMRKIGRLDRFVSRHARESLHAQVRLQESRAKDNNRFTCSVTLHLPQQVLEAEESTINIFAAVDIAETKLRYQLKKYKETHTQSRLRHRFLRRHRGDK